MTLLYSVKMRGAQGGPHEAGGKHISGAERIVPAAEVAHTAGQLVLRAQGHERGGPDFINIKIEALEEIKSGNYPLSPFTHCIPATAKRGLSSPLCCLI